MLNTKHLREHYRLIRIKQQANRIGAILALTALIMLGLIAICHATPTIDLQAIAMIESSNNPMAIGDNGKAYGLYQLHNSVVADFNRKNGTKYRHRDMLNKIIATKVASWYFNIEIPRLLKHYGIKSSLLNITLCYNWGIGNVVKWHKKGAKYNEIPKTTKKYYKKYLQLQSV